MAKYKFDQRRYDISADTFNDFLNKYKKVAKQAFEDRSVDITDTFLFSKLPVQMQNELAMERKHDAMVEEIRTLVQRRCQYAQLLPVTSSAQPFSQISAPQPARVTSQTGAQVGRVQKKNQRRKPKQYCEPKFAKHSPTEPSTRQQAETQPKLVCQICGKVGHSARDFYYRITSTSAFGNERYPKQPTDENKQFRRDFRQTNNRTYNANELFDSTTNEADSTDETEGPDDAEDPKLSKATSSCPIKQKCAPKSTTNHSYTNATEDFKRHGVAVPFLNLH